MVGLGTNASQGGAAGGQGLANLNIVNQNTSGNLSTVIGGGNSNDLTSGKALGHNKRGSGDLLTMSLS